MNRYGREVDGTIPVQALLYEDEKLITSQDGVGLYQGTQKSANHPNGTIHLTTHRFIYVDSSHPRRHSFAVALIHVKATEYYAGFLKSSAKVSFFLGPTARDGEARGNDEESWVCHVCNHRNVQAGHLNVSNVCTLCGVVRDIASSPLDTSHAPASGQPATRLAMPIPQKASHSALDTFQPSTSLPSLVDHSTTPPPPPSSSLARASPESIACPACTFLNHPSLNACELCSTPLPRPLRPPVPLSSPSSTSRPLKSAPASRPGTPDEHDGDIGLMKASFRTGGDKAYYSALKRALTNKAWEQVDAPIVRVTAEGGARSGIHGIFQSASLETQSASQDMQHAFQDLEALMSRAKDMVQLASSLNAKLTAQEEHQARVTTLHPQLPASVLTSSGATEPEEATFIRSSLARLGLPTAAVTHDMVKDDREWTESLAKELAGILVGTDNPRDNNAQGLMHERGILGLDEVWGAWNRARGISLLPPSTLLTVIPRLPMYTTPSILMRTFKSGLRVLHTPEYTHIAFTARLVSRITMSISGPGGAASTISSLSTVEIARDEGLSVGLVAEMIESVEEDGEINRDEGGGGDVRWYVNRIRDFVWDGG